MRHKFIDCAVVQLLMTGKVYAVHMHISLNPRQNPTAAAHVCLKQLLLGTGPLLVVD